MTRARTSANQALATAIRDAVAALPLNGVFEARPARARAPWALLDTGNVTDWSTKDRAGRELRVTLMIAASGETPADIDALAEAACAAVAAMPPVLNGWLIASAALSRRRRVSDGERGWRVLIEWRVLMMEEL